MTLITYLTIVRNDDYYEDFIERIERTLEINLCVLEKLKLSKKVEFLFVDWGSKNSLSRFIKINKKYLKNVRFINISPKVAKRYSSAETNYFNHSLAWNIGIKNSKSKYVMITGSDQFLDFQSWKNLITICSENSIKLKNYYLIPRKIIDLSLYRKKISIKNFLKLLSTFSSSLYKFKAHAFFNGGGFAILCSKHNFIKMRGMVETQDQGVANDIELYFNATLQNFKHINLSHSIFSYKFPPLPNSNRDKLVYSKVYRKLPKFSKIRNDHAWGNIQEKIKFSIPTIKDYKKKKNFFSPINNYNYKTNIYKTLLNLDYFFFNIKDLKKIFLIIKIIEISEVISYFEIGFKNHTRLNIIGSVFKYLNMLCFDYSKKNNNFGYLERTFKSSFFFNKNRYGAFTPLFHVNSKKALEIIDTKKTLDLTNLIIFNELNNKVNFILHNFEFYSSARFVVLFSTSEVKKNYVKKKFFFNFEEIKLDEKNFIFINKKNLKTFDFIKLNNLLKNQYIKIHLGSYLGFMTHNFIRKLLQFLRNLVYSIKF